MHYCPACKGRSKVLDSRPHDDHLRRRRKCLECGHRWTTHEIDADLFALYEQASAELRLARKRIARLEGMKSLGPEVRERARKLLQFTDLL
jgi:transcriptional regulator NrdR family protein